MQTSFPAVGAVPSALGITCLAQELPLPILALAQPLSLSWVGCFIHS